MWARGMGRSVKPPEGGGGVGKGALVTGQSKEASLNTSDGSLPDGRRVFFQNKMLPNDTYPPPLAHARPYLSTGWALNCRFEEILGLLF